MFGQITYWLALAIPSLIGSLLWVPWHMKDDSWQHLGFSPLWSHRFDQVRGASVDKRGLLLAW
jgi:hypothetical protein